jgi:hypothetical protein
MQRNLIDITDLLHHWLSQQVERDGLTWLEEKRRQIVKGTSDRVFLAAFSAVPRYIGKKDLKLTQENWQTIEAIRLGWCPEHWSIDQVARTLLILSLPQDNAEAYLRRVEQVFSTADVNELVALYQALPLLPFPEQYYLRAAEGIRSNMTAVFNAVALRNSYPTEYFDNTAWNQMILKALFVGSPLHLIQGLNRRINPELSQMLIDYANEHQAAKRSVSPELWQLIGVESRESGSREIISQSLITNYQSLITKD